MWKLWIMCCDQHYVNVSCDQQNMPFSSCRTTWGRIHHVSRLTPTAHYSHLPAHYLLRFIYKSFMASSSSAEESWCHNGTNYSFVNVPGWSSCFPEFFNVKFVTVWSFATSKLVDTFDRIRCRLFQGYYSFSLYGWSLPMYHWTQKFKENIMSCKLDLIFPT